ncbi:MAG: outer membrane lipoprotein-sorting protein [Planctomycetota bacterium]|nr:MAG: outer membrane lipoprotein-sorting protein [Planctomycetota bacterium]
MFKFLILISTLSLTLTLVNGEEKQKLTGLDIIKKVDEANNGFKDTVSEVDMELKNRHGKVSTRSMKVKTLEVENDGDKALIIFNRPRDIKGTAFLGISHKVKQDDQWLYLPALKRVKRISSKNKSGPFLGSEFSYEDISSQEVEKYTKYKLIKEEKLNGNDMYVISSVPVDKNSGYSKQIAWVHKTEFRVERIHFYDRKKVHFKTLNNLEYKKYENKFWRPGIMHMVNLINGKETKLFWRNYKFFNDFKDRNFDKNALKRAK